MTALDDLEASPVRRRATHPLQIARAIVAAQVSQHRALARLARRLVPRNALPRDEAQYSRSIYDGFRPHCVGGRTLEIGPGACLGVSVLLARDDCHAFAMDFVDQRLPDLNDVYRELRDGSEAHVHYLVGRIEDMPFPKGCFDFVFSNSCLEHVDDPTSAVREIRRVLRVGGRTVHQIDFRDHRNFEDPLRFLRYGDRLWGLMNTRGPGHQNRWRLSQFVDAFGAAGFEVQLEVNMVAQPRDLAGVPGFSPRYRNLSADDLRTLSARLVAQG